MRPPTACIACRYRRRKCEPAALGQPCAWCRDRLISCSLANDETFLSYGHALQPVQTSSDQLELVPEQNQAFIGLPPFEICEELVRLYFKYIHGTSHSIFHEPTLMEDLISGTLPRVILYAIIGLSARFSTNSFFEIEPRIRGIPFTRESERLLDLRDHSLLTVQACILIGSCSSSEGDATSEAVYHAIACRKASLINLTMMHVETKVEQEINNRVWWTLYMSDVWLSNAFRVPYMMNHLENVSYPLEETRFLKLSRTVDGPLGPTLAHVSSLSLFTQMVKLNAIFAKISAVNKTATDQTPSHDPLSNHGVVDDLTESLEGWHRTLPPQLLDTPENLSLYNKSGLGGVFAAVYLGYYHYGQLLYYQYLHEDCFDDSLHARYYADKCKAHSTALCEILYRAYEIPGCEVYYSMVGHVLVIASTVQLHILLFSSDDIEISAARSRLERNFEILTKLQSFWPTLDMCFERFQEFHKACQKSKESSFRMNRWMLQFLFDFTKPIGEKIDYELDLAEPQSWSMQGFGSTGTDAMDLGILQTQLPLY